MLEGCAHPLVLTPDQCKSGGVGAWGAAGVSISRSPARWAPAPGPGARPACRARGGTGGVNGLPGAGSGMSETTRDLGEPGDLVGQKRPRWFTALAHCPVARSRPASARPSRNSTPSTWSAAASSSGAWTRRPSGQPFAGRPEGRQGCEILPDQQLHPAAHRLDAIAGLDRHRHRDGDLAIGGRDHIELGGHQSPGVQPLADLAQQIAVRDRRVRVLGVVRRPDHHRHYPGPLGGERRCMEAGQTLGPRRPLHQAWSVPAP